MGAVNHKVKAHIHKILYASLHQYFNVQHGHQTFHFNYAANFPAEGRKLNSAGQPKPIPIPSLPWDPCNIPIIHGFCSSESRGTGGRIPAGLSLAWLLLPLPWGERRSWMCLWEPAHCLEPSSRQGRAILHKQKVWEDGLWQ